MYIVYIIDRFFSQKDGDNISSNLQKQIVWATVAHNIFQFYYSIMLQELIELAFFDSIKDVFFVILKHYRVSSLFRI